MSLTNILTESLKALKKFEHEISFTEHAEVTNDVKSYFNNLGVALAITKDMTDQEYHDLTMRYSFHSIYSSAKHTFKEFVGTHETYDNDDLLNLLNVDKEESRMIKTYRSTEPNKLFLDGHDVEQSARVIEGAIRKLEKNPELNERYSNLIKFCYTDLNADFRGQLRLKVQNIDKYVRIEADSETTDPLTERDFNEIGSKYIQQGNGGLLARVYQRIDGGSDTFVNAMDVPYNVSNQVIGAFRQKGWEIGK